MTKFQLRLIRWIQALRKLPPSIPLARTFAPLECAFIYISASLPDGRCFVVEQSSLHGNNDDAVVKNPRIMPRTIKIQPVPTQFSHVTVGNLLPRRSVLQEFVSRPYTSPTNPVRNTRLGALGHLLLIGIIDSNQVIVLAPADAAARRIIVAQALEHSHEAVTQLT